MFTRVNNDIIETNTKFLLTTYGENKKYLQDNAIAFECKITMIFALFSFGLNQRFINVFIIKNRCNKFVTSAKMLVKTNE